MNALEKIEDYVEGKLSPEEKICFEREMAEDEELSKVVAERKLLNAAISGVLSYPTGEITEDENFKLTAQQNILIEEDLLKFHPGSTAEINDKEPEFKRLLKKIVTNNPEGTGSHVFLLLKIAAGFILLLVVSLSILYYTINNNSIRGEFNNLSVCEIFPYENDTYLRNIISSFTIFRQGTDNELSGTDDQTSILDEKSKEVLKLSDAITNLENARLIQARNRLENLIYSDHQDIRVSALWYYSLLCIMEENTDEAFQIIKLLSEEENYYSEKADSLIKIMKRK